MSTEAIAAAVSVVLVDTSHPGNIGAAARAMKNMGLRSLRLVRPRRFPDAEATARASGADDLLAGAAVFGSLEEAIADAALVLGVTGRQRSLRWPQLSARAAGEAVVAAGERTCLLFGNEQSGLGNAELDRCHRLLCIPADPAYDSLNLAMAVQVVAYELRMAALAVSAAARGGAPDDVRPGATAPGADGIVLPGVPSGGRETALATSAQMEALFAHFERTLLGTGFLNPANPRHLMRRLRRLFNRAVLDENESQILRGILASVDRLLADREEER